ncbi:MAG: hypothetical protein RL001_922 [Pseudomonadota bacterium]
MELPQAENIAYVFTENKNNDFGGYCAVINDAGWREDYDYYVFVNSSVRGPFLLSSDRHERWVDRFTAPLSEDVGLVGSTINILSPRSSISKLYSSLFGDAPSYSHVQTTVYGMTPAVLRHLVSIGFYAENECLPKDNVICRYELKLSQEILRAGRNLKCQLPEYNTVDYRAKHTDINPTSWYGDPALKNAYFGRTIHPYEAIFIKTNRGLFKETYLDRLAASMRIGPNLEGAALQSRELMRYRARLCGVAAVRQASGSEHLTLKPEQVIDLARQLAKAHPQYGQALAEVLATSP